MSNTLLVGAVAYDPKVVTIWDGFKQWFAARGLDFDYMSVLELRAPGGGALRRALPRRVELTARLAASRARRGEVGPQGRGDRDA